MGEAKRKMTQAEVFRQYLESMLTRQSWKGAFVPGLWFRDNYREGRATAGEPRLEMKQCVNNALKMAVEEKLVYVEGFVVAPIPIRHAWNQDLDGNWIDYTLEEPEKWHYYGVPLPKEIVTRVAMTEYWEMGVGALEVMGIMPPEAREKLLLGASTRKFLPCVQGRGKELRKARKHVEVCVARCERRATCKFYSELLEEVMQV